MNGNPVDFSQARLLDVSTDRLVEIDVVQRGSGIAIEARMHDRLTNNPAMLGEIEIAVAHWILTTHMQRAGMTAAPEERRAPSQGG